MAAALADEANNEEDEEPAAIDSPAPCEAAPPSDADADDE